MIGIHLVDDGQACADALLQTKIKGASPLWFPPWYLLQKTGSALAFVYLIDSKIGIMMLCRRRHDKHASKYFHFTLPGLAPPSLLPIKLCGGNSSLTQCICITAIHFGWSKSSSWYAVAWRSFQGVAGLRWQRILLIPFPSSCPVRHYFCCCPVADWTSRHASSGV